MRRWMFVIVAFFAFASAACSRDAAPTASTTPTPTTSSTPAAKAASGTAVPGPTPVVVRYRCDDGKTFEARVYPVPLERAIVIVEGRTLDLPQVRSASGIRYSDGTLVYHAKGSEAFIEQAGEMTYRNCHAQ